MTYMPGQNWFEVRISESRVKIARSLGSILAQGFVEGSSADVADNYILPILREFRDRISPTTKILEPHVDRLIAACPGVKKLPLYVSHYDLNEMNVLVSQDHEISGLVDWECAGDLPFGMGLHRITDTIVANNSLGEIEIPKGSKEAETQFWDAVLRDAPSTVLENLEDVQNALHLGSLVFAIREKGTEGRGLGFLSGVLTYRLPQLRGDDDGPFAPEYMPH